MSEWFQDLDLELVAAAAASGADSIYEDPLKYRRMASLAAREFAEYVLQDIECYWHAGNAGGKTSGAAHLYVALCRGLLEIDGRLLVREGDEPDALALDPHPIRLPGLYPGEAWKHWVLCQSYDQARESSVAAYRLLIGRIPHQIGWIDKSKGLIKLIRVKPDGWHSDEPETWSEITWISQEGMTEEDVKFVQGARIDSAHEDEIGKENVRREVRMRRRANRPLYFGHTATPEFKHEWEPLLGDFRGCFRNPVGGRVRIQSSISDNRALGYEDIEKRRLALAGDRLFAARWAGEHVAVAIRCPFPAAGIERGLASCATGRTDLIILREGPTSPDEEDYRDILPSSADLERWLDRERDESYLMVCDPSRGIDDPEHNPCELQVWSWTRNTMVARFGHRGGQGGYLDPDSMGILMDIEGRRYNNALAVVFTTGGFGDSIVARLLKRRYPNIARDPRTAQPGYRGKEYGVEETVTSRSEGINSLIRALNEDAMCCYSRDVYSQMADVVEMADGHLPAPMRRKDRRHHAEAVVCAGEAQRLILNYPAPKIMAWRQENDMEAVLRREMGRPVRVRNPKGRNGSRDPEIYHPGIV